MTEEQNMDMLTEGGSMTWSETWIKAITQPTEQAYQEIANDPGASPTKAYIWIAIASAISAFVSLSLGLLFGTTSELEGGFIFLLCFAIFIPVFSIIGFMIMTGISQGIAGLLGGTGSFSKLSYAYAAYYAPLALVSTGLSIVPLLGLLTFPLGFYGIFLNILAIKSVNQFSWGKAVASSFAVFALIFVVVAVFMIIGLALLGPMIEEIFSTINAGT